MIMEYESRNMSETIIPITQKIGKMKVKIKIKPYFTLVLVRIIITMTKE